MLTRLVLLFARLLQTLNADTIRLHPQNPHYFLFRGKAVTLISSGEHYGAVLNADFDYRPYLFTLEAHGLNYTRLFGGIYKTREKFRHRSEEKHLESPPFERGIALRLTRTNP